MQPERRARPGSPFGGGNLLAVFGGGVAGGLARALLNEIDPSWPWPTVAVNLTGAFLLGFVVMAGRGWLPPAVLTGISVGMLGSLTTFSTFAADLWELGGGEAPPLITYGAVTLIGGVAMALLGVRLGRWMR